MAASPSSEATESTEENGGHIGLHRESTHRGKPWGGHQTCISVTFLYFLGVLCGKPPMPLAAVTAPRRHSAGLCPTVNWGSKVTLSF